MLFVNNSSPSLAFGPMVILVKLLLPAKARLPIFTPSPLIVYFSIAERFPMASLLKDKIKIYKKNYQAEKQICEKLLTVPKAQLFIEIIFMTYSYVHRAINKEAFPKAVDLFDTSLMTGRGRGKYCYRENVRAEGEEFLKAQLAEKLKGIPIAYIV